jgi:DNA-binding winged helix-turn-helix (wHTH) protein
MNQTVPSPEPKRSIRFGVFEVDFRAGELHKNGLKIKLQEQPFLILSLLLERAGEVVTREELRQKLWSADTFVDFDHGLNAAVKRLRQALGDSADNPRFVETLARRGYRFIAPVNQLTKDVDGKPTKPAISTQADSSGTVMARWSGGRLRSSVVASTVLTVVITALGLYWLARREKDSVRPINSLAILPFSNASGDPDTEYLSEWDYRKPYKSLLALAATARRSTHDGFPLQASGRECSGLGTQAQRRCRDDGQGPAAR